MPAGPENVNHLVYYLRAQETADRGGALSPPRRMCRGRSSLANVRAAIKEVSFQRCAKRCTELRSSCGRRAVELKQSTDLLVLGGHMLVAAGSWRCPGGSDLTLGCRRIAAPRTLIYHPAGADVWVRAPRGVVRRGQEPESSPVPSGRQLDQVPQRLRLPGMSCLITSLFVLPSNDGSPARSTRHALPDRRLRSDGGRTPCS